MKLIPLDAVLAEIEKIKDVALEYGDKSRWLISAKLAKDINSIKVTEVDLDREIRKVQRDYKTIEEYAGYPARLYSRDIKRIAEYFFGLGLNASNPLTWEDMECIIKHYQDIMAEKSRVFVRAEDYQELLKRFKVQKGEKV